MGILVSNEVTTAGLGGWARVPVRTGGPAAGAPPESWKLGWKSAKTGPIGFRETKRQRRRTPGCGTFCRPASAGALTVNDHHAGRRLSARGHAHPLAEDLPELLPCPIVAPLAEVLPR